MNRLMLTPGAARVAYWVLTAQKNKAGDFVFLGALKVLSRFFRKRFKVNVPHRAKSPWHVTAFLDKPLIVYLLMLYQKTTSNRGALKLVIDEFLNPIGLIERGLIIEGMSVLLDENPKMFCGWAGMELVRNALASEELVLKTENFLKKVSDAVELEAKTEELDLFIAMGLFQKHSVLAKFVKQVAAVEREGSSVLLPWGGCTSRGDVSISFKN